MGTRIGQTVRSQPAAEPAQTAAKKPTVGLPTVARALQRTAGNRAVAQMLQRQPTPTKARPKVVSQRAVDALDDYEHLLMEAAKANQVNYALWRGHFGLDLQRELGERMNKIAEGLDNHQTPAQVGVDIDKLEAELEAFNKQFWDEHESAKEVWKDLQREVADERQRVGDRDDFGAVEALKVLDEEFARTKRIVDRIPGQFVSEDLIVLDDMLRLDKHVKIGAIRGKREEEAAEADLARSEREEAEDRVNLDDDDSLLKTAWEIFGWDSVGDFAADVALTVVTFGVGKWLRAASKAAKAARRAEKLRELRRLMKLRRAARAKRRLERAKEILDVFYGGVGKAILEQLKWSRDNWSKVGRKIGTDIAAMIAQGSLDNLATTAARRHAKEWLNDAVMKYFGRDDKKEKRLIRLAWAAMLAGRRERALKLLRLYLVLNVRRRLVVNVLYYSSVHAGQLTFPDAKTLKQIGASTAGEVVQDAVLAIPFLDAPVVKDSVEMLRKFLVKEIEGMIA